MTHVELRERFVSAVRSYQQASALRERITGRMGLAGDPRQAHLAKHRDLLEGVLKQQERYFVSFVEALADDLEIIDDPKQRYAHIATVGLAAEAAKQIVGEHVLLERVEGRCLELTLELMETHPVSVDASFLLEAPMPPCQESHPRIARARDE